MSVGSDLGPLVAAASRRHRASLLAAVTHEGRRLVWGYGEPAPDADSLFEIGSITKVFTGVLLARMHLAGELDLEHPVSRHLPAFRLPRWRGPEPTLAHLASHRAGLPNVPKGLASGELAFVLGLRRADPWAELSEGQYETAVRRTASPGASEKVRYSSLGYGLLGEALAACAGCSYERLLRERICLPLGLEQTWIEVPPGERERLLDGHTRRGRRRPPLEDLMPAAGSLRACGKDMLALLEACLQPPAHDSGPALALAQRPLTKRMGSSSIGLGWIILDRRRRPRTIWHNGGTWGFRSFAAFVPDQRLGVVVLANSTRSVDRLGHRLLEAASGA